MPVGPFELLFPGFHWFSLLEGKTWRGTGLAEKKADAPDSTAEPLMFMCSTT